MGIKRDFQSAYCRQNHLSLHGFIYWKKKRVSLKATTSLAEWPVPIPEAVSLPFLVLALCVVPGVCHRIEILSGFDPAMLDRVVRVLRGGYDALALTYACVPGFGWHLSAQSHQWVVPAGGGHTGNGPVFRLVRYVEDGHVTPDNNAAENAIRPFLVGRQNRLFARTRMEPMPAPPSSVSLKQPRPADMNHTLTRATCSRDCPPRAQLKTAKRCCPKDSPRNN